MSQIEKCYSCSYLDTFNCCCSKEPIMMCVSDLADHDKQIRDEVIEEYKLKLLNVKATHKTEVNGVIAFKKKVIEIAEQMKGA